MKIIQFTSVHTRTDTRIMLKEVTSLADGLDADVLLFVQDGLGNETLADSGIRIVDTGPRPRGGRVLRMTQGAWRMYRAVRAARPDIAHFHDPELIPVGIALRLGGVRVVYDVHEDLPRQILSKPYIPAILRRPLSWISAGFEWVAGRMLSAIVPATPAIADRFLSRKSVLVQNYPMPNELVAADATPYIERPQYFAYVGGITAIRSTQQMVEALAQVGHPDARLKLAGQFQSAAYRSHIESLPDWNLVDFIGWVDRQMVARLLGEARAGLIILQPLYIATVSQPNKLFEYMSAGLPVIASDFPLWQQIVGVAECGLLVDPQDTQAIAKAMDWILDNPEEAEAMGKRGKCAVEAKYNWPAEAKKLVAFYNEYLGVPLKSENSKGD